MITEKKLIDFFEEEGFQVYVEKEFAEIEKWTDGGVDMVITLYPFSKEKFIEYVNDFNVDEQIDFYREGELYRKNFTVSQSLKDFRDFKKSLLLTCKNIKKLK